MKAGIIQSCYIPWRGYFDFINSVDLFIIYDNIKYTKQNWRNRNIIKTAKGPLWLSVPVFFKHSNTLISDIEICYQTNWRKKHIDAIWHYYHKAKYFDQYYQSFCGIINEKINKLSVLNERLLRWAMERLDITTPLIQSASLSVSGTKTERLIDLLRKVGADTYLSGPAAECYLDVERFKRAGIGLEYKTYDYEPYPQLYSPFMDNVTILDTLFNLGPEAKNHITSKTPNTVVYSPV